MCRGTCFTPFKQAHYLGLCTPGPHVTQNKMVQWVGGSSSHGHLNTMQLCPSCSGSVACAGGYAGLLFWLSSAIEPLATRDMRDCQFAACKVLRMHIPLCISFALQPSSAIEPLVAQGMCYHIFVAHSGPEQLWCSGRAGPPP